MKHRTVAAACAAVFVLTGCATLPAGKRDPRDPLERVNRSVFHFNTEADRAVFRPAATAWRAAVPQPVRQGLGNFVGNLEYPVTIVNDVLQAKLRDGGRDFVRLVFNSVFGFGFFDPATQAGLERHNEDFGQTLGKWRVPAGPYLVIPLLGPSSLRDAPARLVDEYSNGRHYLQDPYLRWGLWTTDKLEIRASLLDAGAVLDSAYDPYALVRNAWLLRREYQVRDGEVDESAADRDADEPLDPEPAPAASAPSADPPRH